MYQRNLHECTDGGVYVLDKLEAALRYQPVLDSHHYADGPDIEAFLFTFGLSMLRLRPPRERSEATPEVGFLRQPEDGSCHTVQTEEDLLVLLEGVVAFVEAFLYQVVDHRVLEEGRQVVLPEE